MSTVEQNDHIDCPDDLLPTNVTAATFDPETLRAAALAHNRHSFDHEIRVRAWVILWLLDRAFPTPKSDRLRELEPGWDTYHGVPITEAALRAAEGVERTFTLVPHSNGGFQVEIHAAGIDVEIEFNPEGEFESSWVGKS